MADGGVYARTGGKWERVGSGGGSGGGIDVESERANQLLQGDGAQGWQPGMALEVVDAVPADDDVNYEIGDVVFVTGPGSGGSPLPGVDSGLELIMSGSYTSGNIEFNNLFSSEFDEYLFVCGFAPAAGGVTLFLRQNGANNTGQDCRSTGLYTAWDASPAAFGAKDANYLFSLTQASETLFTTFTLAGPFTAGSPTFLEGSWVRTSDTGNIFAQHDVATSWDGVTFLSSSPNANIRVYGYRR